MSVEQEIAIGKQTNAQVRKQTPELSDAAVVRYVRDVTRRLARAATGPKYPYSVAVADSREINAFALPGGPVWIHRGVLEKATNESQVASVLAHEIAHIASRHAARQLTTAAMTKWSLSLLGSLLGNTGGAGGAQVAAEFLASGVFLKFNRDEEREADRVGLGADEPRRMGRPRHGGDVRDPEEGSRTQSDERRGVLLESSVAAGPHQGSDRRGVRASDGAP